MDFEDLIPDGAAEAPQTELTLKEKIKAATLENIPDIVRDIAAIESAVQRAVYIDLLSKKSKVPKAIVARDVEKEIEKGETACPEEEGQPQTVMSAHFPGLIDLALDAHDDVAYVVKHENLLIDTGTLDLTLVGEWSDGTTTFVPPKEQHFPFLLPRGVEILNWYDREDTMLFHDINSYLRRFSFLLDDQWPILVAYAFLTYLQDHPGIFYTSVLLFYGGPAQGKSRTGKALTYICFRGVHLIDASQANIFRLSDELQATLFLDMKDLWQAAAKERSMDILLGRFEKGPMIRRVVKPEKGAFEDSRYYNIFGPTILATNSPIHRILQTRCIPITMPDRPAEHEDPEPRLGRELKERLVAWRARVLDKELPKVAPVKGLVGRMWDISKPMLQVCTLACPDALDALTQAIVEITRENIPDKGQTLEAKIVAILSGLSPTGLVEWKIRMEDVVAELNKNEPQAFHVKPGALGKKIKSLGLPTKLSGGYAKISLTRSDLDALLKQYGIESKTQDAPAETVDPGIEQLIDMITDMEDK